MTSWWLWWRDDIQSLTRPLTVIQSKQALASDDPDIQTQRSGPWEWWPWHPDTMTRPLTVMTLTSGHNVQALDSDDPDIQRQRSGSWQWWPWHPDTVLRPMAEMTLASRHVQALDSDDLNIQSQRSGLWQWWLLYPVTTFRPLRMMTLTSSHNVQALDSDDPDIQSQRSGPWQWWLWRLWPPDTTFRPLKSISARLERLESSWEIVWNFGNSISLEGCLHPVNLYSEVDNVRLGKSSGNWVIPAGTRQNWHQSSERHHDCLLLQPHFVLKYSTDLINII